MFLYSNTSVSADVISLEGKELGIGTIDYLNTLLLTPAESAFSLEEVSENDEYDIVKYEYDEDTQTTTVHYYIVSLKQAEYGSSDTAGTNYTYSAVVGSSTYKINYYVDSSRLYSERITSELGGADLDYDFAECYLSSTFQAQGGALYNTDEIGDITGDFVGNYAYSAYGTSSGGAIYNNGDISSVTGDFLGNYTSSYSTASGGAIYNNGDISSVTGDFISNYAYSSSDLAKGGAIYNNGTISSVTGNFISNYASCPVYAYGGAVYNRGEITDITGDFLGNYAAASEYALGGAIYNDDEIGSITGDFISNYVYSDKRAYGGAIYNVSEIESITGDFINNYTYSDSYAASGGAVYNKDEIGSLTGDFTGNYAYSASDTSTGGAIYNTGTISSITGNFTNNYASGDDYIYGGAIYNTGTISSVAGNFINNYTSGDDYIYGGAIYNTGTISSVAGNFINNYASGDTCVYGGAIYNVSEIGNIAGDFISNYTYSSSDESLGGAVYNNGETSTIGDITGNFEGNYAYSSSSSAYGGAIYNNSTGTIGNITGDFNYNYVYGKGASGGAVYNDSSSTLEDIAGNFKGNYAYSSSSSAAYGGAVYNNSSSTIGDITGDFEGNYVYASASSASGGGAVYNNSSSTIGDVTGDFTYNYVYAKASYGGAVHNNSSSTIGVITGDFEGNYVSSSLTYAYGGAVYNNSSSTIGDITGDFEGNYASASTTASGGAIYNSSSTIGDITGDFSDNYASGKSGHGGAIYNSKGTIGDITGDFEGNYVSSTTGTAYGGAVYNYSSGSSSSIIGNITGSFKDNYAYSSSSQAYGGAVYNRNGTIGDITGDFEGNYAYSSSSSAYGGAIYNYNSTIGSIIGSFTNNYIYSSSSSVYGGAIYNNSSSTIGDITGDFEGNYAYSSSSSAYGGAIYNYNSTIGSIIGNFCGNYVYAKKYASGGAVYNTGTIENVTGDFEGNYVVSSSGLSANGGAVYNSGTINITESSFDSNTAADSGGAIYNTGTLSVSDSIFEGNYAESSNGGAIYNSSSSVTIENSSFDGNYAGSLGGAIYTSRSITIIDSDFGTTALNYQGDEQNDIYIAGGTLTFKTSEDTTSYIMSGIAGVSSSVFKKTGAGTLQLSGLNSGFEGTLTVSEGILAYTASVDTGYAGGSTVIEEGAVLDYTVSSDIEDEALSNVSGEGTINKNGDGDLELSGDVSEFTGLLSINAGSISFVNVYDSNVVSYITGSTYISESGVLNYTASAEDTLENVSGSGTLNKYGEGVLNFTTGDFSGTANIYNGTFNVTGSESGELEFDAIIYDGSTFIYTAQSESEITLGDYTTDKNVSFDSTNENSTAIFSGGTYVLAGDLQNAEGNNVEFQDTEIILESEEYSDYTVKDSVLNMSNGEIDNVVFNSLSVENSSIEIDVALTLTEDSNPVSDTLTVTSGDGTSVVALKEINIADSAVDDGLNTSYTITVLSGLTFDEDNSLDAWSTTVYTYDVSVSGTDLILTAVCAADEYSLGVMNVYEGNRGFQFTTTDDGYTIGESLGTTAAGSFIVKGVEGEDITISGDDKYSFFSVTNDTELTVKNLTIEDAYSTDGGSVVYANNENAVIELENVNITSSSSDGNGGAINNTSSESFTITNGTFSENTSDGLGGAIYTSDALTIINSNFSNNTDSTGENDIYIDDAEVEFKVTEGNTSSISSGVAGTSESVLTKTGSGTLELSGVNENYTGEFVIDEGTVAYTQSEGGSYVGGSTVINENGTLLYTVDDSDTITNVSGSGTLTKSGEGTLEAVGDNSDFTGTLEVSEGTLSYESAQDSAFFNSESNIVNGTLSINNSSDDTIELKNVSGTGTLTKSGEGTLEAAGDNSDFTGTLEVSEGTLNYETAEGSSFYNSSSSIIDGELNITNTEDDSVSLGGLEGSGTVNKDGDGELTLTGDGSSFEGTLNIEGGSLALASGASVSGAGVFADGTSINMMNGTASESASFTTLELNGTVNLSLDVDFSTSTADIISADTVTGDGTLLITSSGLNYISAKSYLTSNVSIQIATGAIADYITLDDSVSTVLGAIYKYTVSYSDGYLLFTSTGEKYGGALRYSDVNPGIMASSVAAQIGGYFTQSQTLQDSFYHMNTYMNHSKGIRTLAENRNRYAITDTDETVKYSRAQIPESTNGFWAKPYTSFESVRLRGGPRVSNVSYGSLFGGDSKMVELKHGFKGVLSAFIGYNGSHQSYDGVSMNQQGGTLGVTGSFYKGNFFTGLTVSAGASAGEAYTNLGTDHFSMLTAGVASKTGYNIEMKEGKFIIQPSLFLGYTFVNTFDYTNAAGVRLNSDPLHALQIVPGIKFITNLKNGWQPYLEVDMVWNAMDKTHFYANDVTLPQFSVRPYVQYGAGIQRTWNERFTGYFKTLVRSGGRNGVVLTLGFRWLFGSDGSAPAKL